MKKTWKIIDGKIPDDLMEILKQRVATHRPIYADGPPEPPWLAFPDYPRFSMGWRMGPGQDYMCEFREWFDGLTVKQRNAYREYYLEPDNWTRFYAGMSGQPDETSKQ